MRGDMIQVYKILSSVYDNNVVLKLPLANCSITRGNMYKLIKERCQYDIYKFNFVTELLIYGIRFQIV